MNTRACAFVSTLSRACRPYPFRAVSLPFRSLPKAVLPGTPQEMTRDNGRVTDVCSTQTPACPPNRKSRASRLREDRLKSGALGPAACQGCVSYCTPAKEDGTAQAVSTERRWWPSKTKARKSFSQARNSSRIAGLKVPHFPAVIMRTASSGGRASL